MKASNIGKTGVAALGGVLAYFNEGFASGYVFLLIGFEALDYLTGIASGFKHGGLSSKSALWGFVKKLCYFALIGVAFGVDYVIKETAGHIGLGFDIPACFGIIAICYLISNEGISILENLSELGVEVPIISKAIRSVRDKINAVGEKALEEATLDKDKPTNEDSVKEDE